MSALLDKELPAQEHTHRNTVLVLAVLLCLCLLCIAYMAYEMKTSTPFAALTKEKILYRYLPLLDTGDEQPSQELIPASFSSPSHSAGKVNRQHPIEMTEKLIPGDTVSDGQITDGQHTSGPEALKVVTVLEENDDLTPVSRINSAEVSSDRHLPGLDISLSRHLDANRVSFNFGFLVFAAHNLDYTGHGFVTGVALPLGERWSFSTGLALNFISRDFLFYPVFQQDVRNELYKYATQIDLDDQETYYSGLRSFRQIYIPIGLNYRINDAVSVTGGVKMRYTYSEDIDQVLKNSAARKIGGNDQAENVFFNHTNFGAFAGINYSFSNRFSVQLDSEWGMTSLIRQDEFNYPSNKPRYDLNLVNLSTQIKF